MSDNARALHDILAAIADRSGRAVIAIPEIVNGLGVDEVEAARLINELIDVKAVLHDGENSDGLILRVLELAEFP